MWYEYISIPVWSKHFRSFSCLTWCILNNYEGHWRVVHFMWHLLIDSPAMLFLLRKIRKLKIIFLLSSISALTYWVGGSGKMRGRGRDKGLALPARSSTDAAMRGVGRPAGIHANPLNQRREKGEQRIGRRAGRVGVGAGQGRLEEDTALIMEPSNLLMLCMIFVFV